MRRRRFPRLAPFARTPRNPLVWTVGAILTIALLIAATDMIACLIEEVVKPEMVCRRCSLNEALFGTGSYRPSPGRETSAVAPNRICPNCGRLWGDYNPYYLKWMREFIREEFGRLYL